jgi:hypothetical protein
MSYFHILISIVKCKQATDKMFQTIALLYAIVLYAFFMAEHLQQQLLVII